MIRMSFSELLSQMGRERGALPSSPFCFHFSSILHLKKHVPEISPLPSWCQKSLQRCVGGAREADREDRGGWKKSYWCNSCIDLFFLSTALFLWKSGSLLWSNYSDGFEAARRPVISCLNNLGLETLNPPAPGELCVNARGIETKLVPVWRAASFLINVTR